MLYYALFKETSLSYKLALSTNRYFMARQREIKELEKEKQKAARETALTSALSQEELPSGFISAEKTDNTPLPKSEQAIIKEIVHEVEQAVGEQEKMQEGSSFDRAIDSLTRRLRKPKKNRPQSIPQVRDEVTLKIEKILEEGLQDAYQEMSVVQKQEFKIKGEQTAFEIRRLMGETHIKIKSIFRLILEWLRMLPGVNRFFLEQEAKIKTDKLISIHEQQKHRLP